MVRFRGFKAAAVKVHTDQGYAQTVPLLVNRSRATCKDGTRLSCPILVHSNSMGVADDVPSVLRQNLQCQLVRERTSSMNAIGHTHVHFMRENRWHPRV
jgi:hypothetical protein